MSNERYVIIVSGERLVFTKAQIVSDPDNYFETYFFGEFSEGARGVRELIVEKDVQLFKLIQAHLRGYEIFPLPDSVIPSYMTREIALANLVREAQFYGLAILEEKIHAVLLEEANLRIQAKPASPKKYKFANYEAEGWASHDITEEGYRTHLSRFLNSPGFKPGIPRGLDCPGYTISVCWMDTLLNTSYYVLLESDS